MWHRAYTDRKAAEAQSERRELNRVLQQHVLEEVSWTESPWSKSISDSFAFYLSDATEFLHRRLGPKLFYLWPFDGGNLRYLRAARVVADDYWRAGIPAVDFGNDLAHAIEHFEDQVEDHLDGLLDNFPTRWLPFLIEAALDGVSAKIYADAISFHLDIVMTAGSRRATFVQLHERNVRTHYDLMTLTQSPIPMPTERPGRMHRKSRRADK